MRAVFFIIGLVLGLSGGYLAFKVPPVLPNTDTVTVNVPFPVPYDVFYPKIEYKDTGSHTILIDSIKVPVPFALPVDTQAIVKDYLAVKRYKIDTTANDIKLDMNIDLYANRILNYNLTVFNERICNKITDNGFKAGLMVGKDDFTPILAYKYNKLTYMAGYDLYGQEKGLRFGLMINIKKP